MNLDQGSPHSEPTYSAGLDLLLRGDYARGWRGWAKRPAHLKCPLQASAVTLWRGQSLAGRSVVLVAEQGLGDEIMFARYVPLVRALSPARLTLCCHSQNMRAFAGLGADVLLDRAATTSLPPTDFWAQLGCLPEIFGTTPDTIPPPVAPNVPLSNGGGIGFVRQGNPDNPNDRYRSLPDDVTTPPGVRPMTPCGDALDSFEQVARLDLLVTVDTSWAHIAGSLGKPVWLLLPEGPGLDWRWLRGREDSPWYPSTRLYRQPSPGDWASVMARVRDDLADL